MSKVEKLVTGNEKTSQKIKKNIQDFLEMLEKDKFIGMAMVSIREDGMAFLTMDTVGGPSRVQLMGMLVDLQYSLASGNSI